MQFEEIAELITINRSLIEDGRRRTGQFDQIGGENARDHHYTHQQTGKDLDLGR